MEGTQRPDAGNQVMEYLAEAARSTGQKYALEECPFKTVFVDITHRCNMACENCYIPNRRVPDLELSWIASVFPRLPSGTKVRLVGAEPTLHRDLAEMIVEARKHRLHPSILTNGLKLTDLDYLDQLKVAGLRVVYLSLNGGFDDDAYLEIDGLACGERKRKAFENLCRRNMYISLGVILVRGSNEHVLTDLVTASTANRQVRELHLRSVGKVGRHMETEAFSIQELVRLFEKAADLDIPSADIARETATSWNYRFLHRLSIHFTEWPDLGSSVRGRLTPEGFVEPFFEHVLANEGGY